MTRPQAIANAADYFDRGVFKSDLARRVAIPSESQNPDARAELQRYVRDEMTPALEALAARILPRSSTATCRCGKRRWRNSDAKAEYAARISFACVGSRARRSFKIVLKDVFGVARIFLATPRKGYMR
jgi:uncharacterized protein (DUF885 family)